ncbi:MAG: sialate O-acetylesterase [Verrucomicrobiae bacterium]
MNFCQLMHIHHGLLPNQILQRNHRGLASATVTGETTQLGKVTATIRGLRGWKAKKVGVAKRGKFSAQLNGLPVGGPYRIEFCCGVESVVVDGVRVGDVWLLAGQSNMQGIGDLATALRRAPGVFSATMSGRWAAAVEPIHLMEESPDPVHTTRTVSDQDAEKLRCAANTGAGPALSFAAEMFRRTGVPQGLIPCAHGGTSLTQWSPALKHEAGKSLYGSMLRAWRATGQPVAGLLWYQGESDATEQDAAIYIKRFTHFIRSVRCDLNQRQLPVLTVQIGRVVNEASSRARAWNSVQEQQRQMPEKIARVGVVPAVDLPLCDPIHLSGDGQRRLGLRLARLASRLVHGDRKELPPPQILCARRVRESIPQTPESLYEIRCANVVGGLRGPADHAVTLVDANHKIVEGVFRVRLEGDRLLVHVWTACLKPGLRFMYGHGCNPSALVTDGRDLALPVAGPLKIENEYAYGPAVVKWAGGETIHSEKLANLSVASAATLAQMDAPRIHGDTWWPAFMNFHERWAGRSGVACCTAEVEIKSAARLLIGLGYDGPIRVWLDDLEIHHNPNGINPVVADEAVVAVRLAAGKHRLTVAMDLNGGLAWGFTLRWLCVDGYADPNKLVWPTVD